MGKITLIDNNILLDDNGYVQMETPAPTPWYIPTSNTKRYYKLDNLNDSGVDNVTLTNVNSVDFTGGLATLNGVDSLLKDDVISWSLPSIYTIFGWFRLDTLTLYGASVCSIWSPTVARWLDIRFGYYGPGDYRPWLWLSMQDSVGGIWSLSSSWSVGNQATGSTWYNYCLVINGTNGSLYTGSTSKNLASSSTSLRTSDLADGKLGLGAQKPSAPSKFLDGQLSGFIYETTAWSTTKIDQQVAKGPYYSY